MGALPGQTLAEEGRLGVGKLDGNVSGRQRSVFQPRHHAVAGEVASGFEDRLVQSLSCRGPRKPGMKFGARLGIYPMGLSI
jgi:hypothetical protein